MDHIRIVKVIHQEDAPKEVEVWIRRLIVQVLITELKAHPGDIGAMLKAIEPSTD